MRECERCGECCISGGPALHDVDKELLLRGYIGHGDLVTVRKGERVMMPLAAESTVTPRELVKISGVSGTWSCRFYDQQHPGCTIYAHRPLECRELKCWDPERILALAGKETLARKDLINPGDPVLDIIERHDEECSCALMEQHLAGLLDASGREEALEKLSAMARRDIAIRQEADARHGVAFEHEMFLFGRPVFKLLASQNITAYEENGRLCLKYIGDKLLAASKKERSIFS